MEGENNTINTKKKAKQKILVIKKQIVQNYEKYKQTDLQNIHKLNQIFLRSQEEILFVGFGVCRSQIGVICECKSKADD